MMSQARNEAAQRIVQIMPVIMRVMGATLRKDMPSLSLGHFRVLHTLATGPRNLSELARIEQVSLPTMSNTVSTLVERGWVERKRDDGDRRRVVIAATPEGTRVFTHLLELANKRIAELLEPLTDDECISVYDSLGDLDRCLAIECNEVDTFQVPASLGA